MLPSGFPSLLCAFQFSGLYRTRFSYSAIGVALYFEALLYVNEEFGISWCVCVCTWHCRLDQVDRTRAVQTQPLGVPLGSWTHCPRLRVRRVLREVPNPTVATTCGHGRGSS